ncbi:MAG: NUDIX domain-containing protein [Candidatus Magnetoovum sp. WYHC-5]|nr:NUDIX domain-containing protein [Candidatus Magnetoovum sp. WYHC-5]
MEKQPMNNEMLDVVDEMGKIVGRALRSTVHGDNSLLHCVVHVFVFDNEGRLLLQKRSMSKDVAPGKWDTSVGGHVDLGEAVEDALYRELKEELGITAIKPVFMYKYIHKNHYESELVHSYRCKYVGAINFNKEEIDDVRYFSVDDIRNNLQKGLFSDNFEDEFLKYCSFLSY